MNQPRHVRLTSHPSAAAPKAPALDWGAASAAARGPVIVGSRPDVAKNAVGTYGGAYALFRALAVSAGTLQAGHRPDLTDTAPAAAIGPHPQWSEANRIVSLDPFGHVAGQAFADQIAAGADIRPTIAITKARLTLPEVISAIATGTLKPDGKVLLAAGDIAVTKVAVDPVWHLPGIAARLKIDERQLRRTLFEHTGGMYPELVTRPDLQVFLPPIAGHTLYIMGDPATLADPAVPLAARVHDECNGSDVFGSDICTCRPYLIHGIEACIEMAQAGGNGLIVYNRKEGRALGEVTKFLVYNARKRNPAGDTADAYFARTECVAGVQDARFQELMPDVLHWLGIRRIDRFVSMSNDKHDAIAGQGIQMGERVAIPEELVPDDARVEIDAKIAAGYFTVGTPLTLDGLRHTKGRKLDDA